MDSWANGQKQTVNAIRDRPDKEGRAAIPGLSTCLKVVGSFAIRNNLVLNSPETGADPAGGSGGKFGGGGFRGGSWGQVLGVDSGGGSWGQVLGADLRVDPEADPGVNLAADPGADLEVTKCYANCLKFDRPSPQLDQ